MSWKSNIWDINEHDIVTIGAGKTRWIVTRTSTEYAELVKETDPDRHYYGIALRRLTKQPRERVEKKTRSLENLRGF